MVLSKTGIYLSLWVAFCSGMVGCRKHDDRSPSVASITNNEINDGTKAPLGSLGRTIYANNCASCHHGDFQNTTLKDRSVQEITQALQTVSSMQKFASKLTEADIRELALSLRSDTDLTPPQAPQAVSSVAMGPTSIAIRWSASTDNVTVSGYRIHRESVLIKEIAAENTQFLDENLSPSTLYHYVVSSFDKAGNVSLNNSSVQAQTSELRGADTTPPSIPTGLKGTVLTSTRIKLEWIESQDNVGGSGLKEYQVFRNGSVLANVSSLNVVYVDANLASGTSYQYQVLAVDNSANVSSKSAPISLLTSVANGTLLYNARCTSCHQGISDSEVRNFTALQIKTAIENQSAMAPQKDLGLDEIAAIANVLSDTSDTIKPSTPGSFVGVVFSHQLIGLSWTVSTDTGGSGMKSYKLYRNNSLLNGSIAKNITSYSDGGLSPSTNYVYRLTAVDNAGNESIATANLNLQTQTQPTIPDTTKPTTPTNFRGTPSSYDKIVLNWNASTDVGGSGMAKYKIFQNGVLSATLNVPTVSHTVSGLIPSTQYRYKIIAVDGAQNESVFSSEITVRTQAADGAELYVFRGCRGCHGSLADSNLKFRTATVTDFVALFNGAIRTVGAGGIAEMQGKGINSIELEAIATLLAGEDSGGGNPDTLANYEYRPPAGIRTFVSSFFLKTFLNTGAPTTEETALMNILKGSVGDNASIFGGSCSRYDADCPQVASNHAIYNEASSTPNFDAARAGTILNLCAQMVESDPMVNAALVRAGLTATSIANAANVTKSYNLFFPARSPSQSVTNALVQLHSQSKVRGMTHTKAWQMVLLPLCEWSIGGGI